MSLETGQILQWIQVDKWVSDQGHSDVRLVNEKKKIKKKDSLADLMDWKYWDVG